MNNFESPREVGQDAASRAEELQQTVEGLRPRVGRKGVKSSNIRMLALFMLFSGLVFFLAGLGFLALILMSGDGAMIPYGVVAVLPGAAALLIGWGMWNYRIWAWWGAVCLVLPVALIGGGLALFGVALEWGVKSRVECGGVAIFSVFMAWALLSNSGRDRYQLMGASIAKQKQLAPLRRIPDELPSLDIASPGADEGEASLDLNSLLGGSDGAPDRRGA